MTIDSIEAVLRAQFEPLQYAAFFGALLLFGILETWAAAGPAAPERRRRWPANAALTALNILLLGAIPVSAIAVADVAASRGWGLLNHPSVPFAAALVLGFALRSLVSYGIHVAMHKVGPLWRIHRVHHTDERMDVTTTVRFHPLEFAISVPIVLVATLALGLPALALLVYELVDAAMAVFTHADLRLPPRLDRALRWLVMTPSLHRTHHSSWQPETDSNYGATLSWWDWLFGTMRTGPMTGAIGLAECDARTAAALPTLLAMPFRAARAP